MSLTEVPGLLDCSDLDLAHCEDRNEVAFMKQHPGLIRRDKEGVATIRLSNGSWMTMAGEWPQCWQAMTLQAGERYLSLMCVAEEFTSWRLVDRTSGRILKFDGYPYLSPNSQHIVVAKRNEMEGHILDVFDLAPIGATLAFRAMVNDTNWSPRRVCWLDNATVGYTRVNHGNSGHEELPGRREYLKLEAGKWRVDATPPAKADHCNDQLS